MVILIPVAAIGVIVLVVKQILKKRGVSNRWQCVSPVTMVTHPHGMTIYYAVCYNLVQWTLGIASLCVFYNYNFCLHRAIQQEVQVSCNTVIIIVTFIH